MAVLSSDKQKRTPLKIFIVLLVFALGAAGGFLALQSGKDPSFPQAMVQDLERISTQTYDTVFFSMYPAAHYKAEDFVTYHDWNPIFSSYQPRTLTELSEYLDAAFAAGKVSKAVCLGLDPYQIWLSTGRKTKVWNQDLRKRLLNYVEEAPSLPFEILLPSPSLEYWLSFDETELEYAFAAYRGLISHLSDYENVTIFFLGAEEWLIANPDNYTETFDFNDLVAQEVFGLALCDLNDRITPDNMDDYLDSLLAQITKKRRNPTPYPDLSDWRIVFFGDSMIGNYTGSTSIPGVVSGLSGASCYNYGRGGAQAADKADYEDSFPDAIERFCAGELSPGQEESPYPFGTEDDGAQLCFVIDYGLFDYFSGSPVSAPGDPGNPETFEGALRTGIRSLRQKYPDALVLVVSPTFCAYYNNGSELQGESGGTLTDYVDAAGKVALEEGVLHLDAYRDLGIDADNYSEYLTDGCLMNQAGRFLLGQEIIALLRAGRPNPTP